MEQEYIQDLSSGGRARFIEDIPTESQAEESEATEVDEVDAELEQLLSEGNGETVEAEAADEDSAEAKAKAFGDAFKDATGYSVEDVKSIIEELRSYQQQRSADEGVTQMAAEWGVTSAEASERLAIVAAEFNKLKATDKPKYDNVQGARKLWANYSARQKAPTSSKGSATTSSARKGSTLTRAEIDAMSPAERASRHGEIVLAYSQGLVK